MKFHRNSKCDIARARAHTHRKFSTDFSFLLKVQFFPLGDKNWSDGLVHTMTSRVSGSRFCQNPRHSGRPEVPDPPDSD